MKVSKVPDYMLKSIHGKEEKETVVLVTKGKDMRIFLDLNDLIKIAREFNLNLTEKNVKKY